jgi:5-methylcytosine-specific restriction endonuclease McrA
VEGGGLASDENLLLRIKHTVLREEKIIEHIRREIEAFENLDKISSARRERIPESVRLFVWQRDEGKCVKCGSQESLEFDHIIPVALGGSNTERNIQKAQGNAWDRLTQGRCTRRHRYRMSLGLVAGTKVY